MMVNRKICIDPPIPYQRLPLTPQEYAKVLLVRSVAGHVQLETTAEEIRPVISRVTKCLIPILTLRLAVEYISESCSS